MIVITLHDEGIDDDAILLNVLGEIAQYVLLQITVVYEPEKIVLSLGHTMGDTGFGFKTQGL